MRDAKQVKLQHALSTIKTADFKSPPAVTVWLQFCRVLCLHYDDQQDKEPLWQCLERIFLDIARIKNWHVRQLHDAVETTLLATSMPAGFIRILQRAIASKWQEDRLLALFKGAKLIGTLPIAIQQLAAGLHPEKKAQQAAADFLLARCGARAAHTVPQLRAAPDAPQQAGLVANGYNGQTVTESELKG